MMVVHWMNSILLLDLLLPSKMRDINEIMPKVPNMKWGALTNAFPTNDKIKEMDKLFPHDGRWHTVFEEPEQVFVDGVRIWKKDPTKLS
jgi:hypothetical protein